MKRLDITDLLTDDEGYEPAFHLRGVLLGVTLGLLGWGLIALAAYGIWVLAT